MPQNPAQRADHRAKKIDRIDTAQVGCLESAGVSLFKVSLLPTSQSSEHPHAKFKNIFAHYQGPFDRYGSGRWRLLGSVQTSTAGKQGQSKERLLEKGTFRKEAIRVVSMKAKGKPIESGKKFVEDDDWVNSLTIRLKNVSPKPIVFFEVSLTFPANADQPYGPRPGYLRDIKYGREPLSSAVGSNQLPPVMPNDFVELTLSDTDREAIEGALTQLDYPKGIYVKMTLRTVIFEDDTMWRAGETLTRDPEDPSTWKVVPRADVGASSKRHARESQLFSDRFV